MHLDLRVGMTWRRKPPRMSEPTTVYEVVLRRDEIAEFIRCNLSNIRHVFGSLDHLAGAVRNNDDHLTEVVNSVADILRGVLAERHGVDFRPTSDLGSDEVIDLSHTIHVLTRLVGELVSLPSCGALEASNDQLTDLSDSATP